jgi:cold shock CspA family protein
MKSLASGVEFSDLHSGDEVEFLLVTNKAKKNSAIHVKKLRYRG